MRPIGHFTRSKKTTHGRSDTPSISTHSFTSPIIIKEESDSESKGLVKIQSYTKAEGIVGSNLVNKDKSDGNYKEKNNGLRERHDKHQIIDKGGPSSDSDSSYHRGPKKPSKNREERSSDSDSSQRDRPKKLSHGQENQKASGVGDHFSSYHAKSSKIVTRQDKSETDCISDDKKLSEQVQSKKLVKPQVKSEVDDISHGNPNFKHSPRPTRSRQD